MKTTCVICDGPISGGCDDNDEFPVWSVFSADVNGDPTGQVFTCYAYCSAVTLAQRIAKDNRLELVMEAMPAN